MRSFVQIWCGWEFVSHASRDPDLYHAQCGHFTVAGSLLIAECIRNRNKNALPREVHSDTPVRLERYGAPGWFMVIPQGS